MYSRYAFVVIGFMFGFAGGYSEGQMVERRQLDNHSRYSNKNLSNPFTYDRE